jgi:hypothetical protein
LLCDDPVAEPGVSRSFCASSIATPLLPGDPATPAEVRCQPGPAAAAARRLRRRGTTARIWSSGKYEVTSGSRVRYLIDDQAVWAGRRIAAPPQGHGRLTHIPRPNATASAIHREAASNPCQPRGATKAAAKRHVERQPATVGRRAIVPDTEVWHRWPCLAAEASRGHGP